MLSFLRILLIFFITYYVFKFLFKVIGSIFFPNYSNNFSNKNVYNRKEGEVHIDDIPKQKKRISKDKGEYIDYEEVEE